MKRTSKKGFGWTCGYEKCYGSFHPDNERCNAHSKKHFNTKEDAARAALNAHSEHSRDLNVFSYSKGYVGMAEGINFHITKS